MDRPQIIKTLRENHDEFLRYINELSDAEFLFSHPQKWSAGQQLAHIVKCVEPLVQAFHMPHSVLAQNFGTTDRPGRSYDELLADYEVQLNAGGKAPSRFVPEAVTLAEKQTISAQLEKSVHELCAGVERFSEDELDTYQLPHPLLKHISLREMLYNAICHVKHHQQQAVRNLQLL